MVSNGPMNAQRRPRPSLIVWSRSCGETVAFADQPERLGQQRALQPVEDEAVDLALHDDRHLADALDRPPRARAITSGQVHGAPHSSTTGTRCGGLTGWATRQRARPGERLGEARGDDRRRRRGEDGLARREPRRAPRRSRAWLRRLGSVLLHEVDAARPLARASSPTPTRAAAAGGSSTSPCRASASRLTPRSAAIAPAATPSAGRRATPSSRRGRRRWPTSSRSVRRRSMAARLHVQLLLTARGPCAAGRDRRAAAARAGPCARRAALQHHGPVRQRERQDRDGDRR